MNMAAVAGEGRPMSTSSSFTIPEIVIECYDTPDDLFDPFEYDLWLTHDPDSFVSSDEALDDSDEEDCCSEILEEVDLSTYAGNGSSPEMDDDTLPYLTYFVDQAKIKQGSKVEPTVWYDDQNMASTSSKAVEAAKPKSTSNLEDIHAGESREMFRLLDDDDDDDDASRSHHCSRPCLYVYSGPHIKREPCSLEQSPLERTRPLTAELTDRREPRVEEPLTLHPTPSPRQVPKPESRADTTSDLHTSPEEPVAPGISGEVSPVSHISVHRVSVGISPSEAVKGLEDKTVKEKPDEGKAIEEDVQSYSDRKKFWEQMTTSQTKSSVDTVIKQRTLSQESAAPPVPKPRASIPSPAPLISVLQESGIVKSETESDTETTTFSDSTIRMHPPPASVSKQSTFTGSSDTSDREGSETEATDIAATQITGVPTTATSAVTAFTQDQSHTEGGEGGSSDSEAEYLAKCADKPLAYDNTAFVGDDESKTASLEDSEEIPPIVDKRALFEKRLEPVPASRKIYERSVSLPTEDLVSFDHNGSVRAKKRYFEAQIKKEMVVEQLMTQLEEEASPEHKSIHQAAAKQAADQERMVSRQIHSDIFSHELDENIDSLVPEDKDILSIKEVPASVKDATKESQQSTDVDKMVSDLVKVDEKEDKKEIYVEHTKKEIETKVTSVRELAKGFEKDTVIETVKTEIAKEHEIKPKEAEVKHTSQGFEKEIQGVTAEMQEKDYDEKKGVRHIRSVFEGKYSEEAIEKEGMDLLTEKEDVDLDLPSGEQEEDMSDQLAEVMHYKTEIITKPSDSLEVHVDKSEIEETEKERDIDEDIKAMESRADEDVIPSITVTLSGKQRTESYSQGESEDTQSESDVTPEEHPLYQPEEHIHDTVWEVPVQEQPESIVEEIVHEIPIERQVIVEKDEEEEEDKEESEEVKLSQEEARIIAEEVVDSIEAEVAKRAELISDTVPPPELAESQVTEYLRQLAGKEELEPREVQLMESVLASKHREEMKRLSRTDTTTSSMEITDEDLRSSGVETDLSPLDSQAGKLHERTLSDDTQYDDVGIKLQGEEVVEKTLAEVRETKKVVKEEIHLGKEGLKEIVGIVEELSEEHESKTRESKFEDVATMKKDKDIVGEKRTSATFSDEEEHLLLSKILEKEITGADGSTKAVKIAEEKECIGAVSEEKLVIQSKVEDQHEGSIYAKEDITRAQTATTKLEEKSTKVEETSGEGLKKTEITGQTDSRSEVVVEKSSTSKVVDHVKGDDLESYHSSEVSKSEQKTEEAVKTERKIEVKKSFKVDTVPSDAGALDQIMPTLTEGIELSREGVKFADEVEFAREGVKFAEKEEIRRTSSEESQRSFSQDESTKSPIDSSSSSGRHVETETVRVVERPDGSEATVVVLRHPRQPKPGDAESSSSGERSGSATLRADRRSGADFEAWSSSGESHYHSFEQTSESGRTYSRPCSSDVEALMAGVGTAGSSEYESALTSQEISTRSTSHDYHTAVSSLSSRDSMKSLDSESSGHLASIEVSSEASETLVPSALELEKDMEGATGALVMDDEDIERREIASSRPPVIEEVVEPYDTAIPVHVIRGESPPRPYETHTRTVSYISDAAGSSDMNMPGIGRGEPSQLEDGRHSPFEIISESEVLEFPGDEIAVSEDEEIDIVEGKEVGILRTLSTDDSGSEDRPHCMKRSHEMIFQPEPRPIITDSPLSETGTEEKFGSSVEEGSILSVSLSSTSEASGLRTVIELSRADSERMDASATSEQLTVSGTSEQLSSLDDIDTTTTGTQFVDSGTCTYPTSTSGRELHLSSVTITTSSVDEYGVQSVCTQVTSQSHTPVPEDDDGDEDHEDDDSQRETTNRMSGHNFPQSNGPTQVDYIPEYDDEYDDSRKRHMGHRRKESTSSFVPSMLPTMTSTAPSQVVRPIPELSPIKVDVEEDMAESDKYTETGPLTLKEVRSDEKKDVDEAERLEEESYQTEADQGFHRDLREGRVLLEDVAGIEEDPEAELDSSRPQSQVSKSDSEGHRPMSSGFSDDHPDSELAELLKQCSDGGKDLEDPIERPLSPEPADECEIKDDTPEFSSEAQASVTELEMEYSGAFSRSVEYASHVSPIREERTGIQYDEACSVVEHPSDHEDEMAEAEAAFQMAPHIHPVMPASLPATIPEDPAAEKHELETRDRHLKESKKHQETMATSPGSIPDITVTQHMTPLIDRGFHYPDLELEEEAAAAGKSAPQTPASVSSRASSETETDQGREYVLEEEERDDYIGEEPELEEMLEDKHTESRSVDEFSAAEDKTVYESNVKIKEDEEIKPEAEVEPPSPTTESPESDSFEMLEKPDLTDEYVVIEEVGKEAEEHDTEGKSVQITKKTRVVKKKRETSEEEELISSPPAPATRMTELKYYPEPGEDMGPFPFDSDSPPTAATTKKSVGVRAREYGFEGEEGEYDRDVEAGKKWIEMQFQGDAAAAAAAVGYGYEMEFERGPLEDIKEEEINDFDQSSSKVGSMGSYKGSIGSFGSVKESLSSTPEYDVLAGRKFFTRSGEHDDVSMSSLQEFEQLERQIALDAARKRSHGSQDSLNGNNKRYNNSRSGQGDDVSLSSLKEFEGLETACIEAAKIETRAKEEEALLSEIEEGHESQVSESESCETMSVGDARGILGGGGESVDSDDYEKRMFEIDEIIRQAQSNVERFIDPKDDVTESVGRGDSLEEVARVPELDLDQPLYPFATKMSAGWREAGDDVMRTSSDSLESKDKSSAMHASTDSLDLKTVADAMTTSADSIELQMQLSGRGDVMTDSIELPADSGMMATSTDSLDLGGGPATGVTAMTDSIEEEEEMSMLGQGEGQGSGSGGHDQSSSSGREGDLSSSGKDDNSAEHGRVPPPRSDMMLGSTDSLEPSSSTATHATYQYETDSVMSSSFTSGGSNTMVSSTDTLDPTGAVAGGLDAIDLAAAARQAGVWFDETDGSAGKPFVTEVIEPSEEDEYSHTIRRTVELPPEIRKKTIFRAMKVFVSPAMVFLLLTVYMLLFRVSMAVSLNQYDCVPPMPLLTGSVRMLLIALQIDEESVLGKTFFNWNDDKSIL
ncbi:hypothetical protein C0J52_26276 [Blattella germanica]|nr:hypothetical protein C0J52_26276 [Blattella germanica]